MAIEGPPMYCAQGASSREKVLTNPMPFPEELLWRRDL